MYLRFSVEEERNILDTRGFLNNTLFFFLWSQFKAVLKQFEAH